MASTQDMVDYVSHQLSDAGEITHKKMFGEYGLYCNGIYFGCITNNQLFIKPTATNVDLLKHPNPAPPYDGAKPSWRIEDLEDREQLTALVIHTCKELGRKPKKQKKHTAKEHET